MLQDNLLTQHVTNPTRARGKDCPSVLDLVIANDDFVDDIIYLSPLGKSDHTVLEIHCNFWAQNKKREFNTIMAKGTMTSSASN